METGDSETKPAPSGLFRSDEDYQQLFRALVAFCCSNGSNQPNDDASETIVRLYQREADGVSIENLDAYAMGIARNVISENRREHKQETEWRPLPIERPAPEALIQCLERCQRKCLSVSERRLIKAYYEKGSDGQIAGRAKLAKHLRITKELLKIRAHRIRKKLESCVMECWEKKQSFDETEWQILHKDRETQD